MQQIDTNIALLIGIDPAFYRRVALHLRLLLLGNGVHPRRLIIEEPRRLQQALLLVKLKLGRRLDKPQRNLAFFQRRRQLT